jgi:hypothetical protein
MINLLNLPLLAVTFRTQDLPLHPYFHLHGLLIILDLKAVYVALHDLTVVAAAEF